MFKKKTTEKKKITRVNTKKKKVKRVNTKKKKVKRVGIGNRGEEIVLPRLRPDV